MKRQADTTDMSLRRLSTSLRPPEIGHEIGLFLESAGRNTIWRTPMLQHDLSFETAGMEENLEAKQVPIRLWSRLGRLILGYEYVFEEAEIGLELRPPEWNRAFDRLLSQ
jgi:hypothetical protein